MRAFKVFPKLRVKTARLSKVAQTRLCWFDWYLTHNRCARLTIRHFGVSPDTFYRWKRRFNPYSLKTLEEKKRGPRFHFRTETTPQDLITKVKEIRKRDLEKSKYEIQAELKSFGLCLGTTKIQKIVNNDPQLLNTQHLKRLKKYRNFKIARIKAARELREKDPGSLVQIDTKYLYILGVRFYLFAAVDCKSRYGFIWASKTASSQSAADFLLKVSKYFPFSITAVNTDNGPEYLLNFHKICQDLGIIHYFIYPHTPKMNGRAERLIQTAEYEFFNWQDDLLPDLEMINQKCAIFNDKYNNHRFHQAIGYQLPAMYLKTMLEKKGEVYG